MTMTFFFHGKQLFSFFFKMVLSSIISHLIKHMLSVFSFSSYYFLKYEGKNLVLSEKIKVFPYISFSECITFINDGSKFLTLRISISNFFPFIFQSLWCSAGCGMSQTTAFLCQTPVWHTQSSAVNLPTRRYRHSLHPFRFGCYTSYLP